MAGGIKLEIDVRGVRQVMAIVARLSRKMETRRDLHRRWSVLAYNWVMRNFATEGGNVGGWPKLSPNTIANRRKGSGRILQDTGALRGSFAQGLGWDDEKAWVGSPMQIALYHEKGTGLYGPRGSKYIIKPKREGGVLAFKMAGGGAVKVKASFSSLATHKTFKKGEQYTFAKSVEHPGVQIRRMLPTANDTALVRDFMKAGLQYLSVKEASGNEE